MRWQVSGALQGLTKDRKISLAGFVVRLYASKALGAKKVGSVMSKLANKLEALLAIGKTDQNAVQTIALHKRLCEGLLMWVHIAISSLRAYKSTAQFTGGRRSST